MMQTVTRTKLRFGTIIIAIVFALVGLALMVVSIKMEESNSADKLWTGLLNMLATTSLIGGVWTAINEFIIRREFIRINDENAEKTVAFLMTNENEKRLGLQLVSIDSLSFDYAKLIEESTRLIVVMNDGRTWISTHSERLEKRLRDRGKTTVFAFLNPESAMVKIQARKEGLDEHSIQMKIAEAVQTINEMKSADSKVQILGHFLYNTHTIYISDDYAIVTPYFISRARRSPPVYKYVDVGDDCYYRKLVEDIDALLKDSKDISNFKNNMPAAPESPEP
jgi:hypothetical protein